MDVFLKWSVRLHFLKKSVIFSRFNKYNKQYELSDSEHTNEYAELYNVYHN